MNAPTPPAATASSHAETPDLPSVLGAELAAAMEWWDLAGVDQDFADDPADWLADAMVAAAPGKSKGSENAPVGDASPAQKTTAPPPAQKAMLGGEKSAWPTDLAAFRKWWLEEKTLSEDPGPPRIAPRGEAGARLMIIVPHPEQADTDALLSGAEGRLMASMLSAMRIASEEVYIASALPRHTAMPDWDGLTASGLGDILAHHVKLASPKRLLLLGRRVLPLLAHDTAQGSVALREFNHESGNIPAAAAAGLDAMLAQPGERARFWRRWLEWTASD